MRDEKALLGQVLADLLTCSHLLAPDEGRCAS
jgi:hypothetical protein